MAIVVKPDTIYGTKFILSEDGYQHRRRYKVTGLDVFPADNLGYRAITAPGIPVYGDPHPSLGGLLVNYKESEPVNNSKTECYVTVGYIDTPYIIKINGNVVRENTRFNNNNDLLVVDYQAGIGEPSTTRPPLRQQMVEIPILRPGMTLEYEWITTSKNFTFERGFIGSVNSILWNSGNPFTWLCLDISSSGTFVFGRKTLWRKHAAFQFKGFKQVGVDTHRVVIMYQDPHTRKVPTDINPKKDGYPARTVGNGWRVESPQPSMNFNQLQLPVVF